MRYNGVITPQEQRKDKCPKSWVHKPKLDIVNALNAKSHFQEIHVLIKNIVIVNVGCMLGKTDTLLARWMLLKKLRR
jgi:hypothetical protein